MDYLLLFFSTVFILIGLIGCVLPALPGPPLSYIGLLLLHFSIYGNFSNTLLLLLAVFSALVVVLDYAIPVWGTKKFGGSKYGQWGAMLGLIVGIFLGPLGIIVGPFAGAFVGELIVGTNVNTALKSGLGSFVGFLVGMGLKLIVSGIITYYFIKELWLYFTG